MTCARAKTLLALHVEGDLGIDESRAVEAHLAACAACASEIAAYERSQGFLREAGPAPFGERDYAEIRRAVRERLDDRAARSTLVRRILIFLEGKRGAAVLVAAAGLLLVAGITMLPFRKHAPDTPRTAAAHAQAEPLFPSKKDPAAVPAPASVALSGGAQTPFPSKQKGLGALAPTLPVQTAVASAVSRIELQTSNPNVRIIWLVGPQPARPPETDSEDGI